MKLPEYTISPECRDAILRAFEPFLRETIDGVPLAQWLDRQRVHGKDYIPPYLKLRLAITLDNLLLSEGGKEGGVGLLETFASIVRGEGKPAVLIHGLPKESAVSPIIREAFRQVMQPKPKHFFETQLRIKDEARQASAKGFLPEGQRYLHVDDADIGLMFGVIGGTNPRHTEIVPLSEYIDLIAARMAYHDCKVSSAAEVTSLLKQPIWAVKVEARDSRDAKQAQFNAQRLQKASSLQILWHRADGKAYAPILYDNPGYRKDNPDSQPYAILDAPFTHLEHRLNPDFDAIPPELTEDVTVLIEAMNDIAQERARVKKGPVLQEGDMMVFNNHLVLHAGGSFIHNELPQDTRQSSILVPREIISMDSQTAAICPGYPGSHIQQPIILSKGNNPHVHPATFER